MKKKFTDITAPTCAYPFLYDEDSGVDYEIHTDMMASRLGLILGMMEEKGMKDPITEDLTHLHTKLYDLNGSVRGRNVITKEDVQHLKQRYAYYTKLTKEEVKGFLLPAGNPLIMECHLLRCEGKQLVRLLYRLEKEGFNVSPELFDVANLLSNLMFAMANYLTKLLGLTFVQYESQNY